MKVFAAPFRTLHVPVLSFFLCVVPQWAYAGQVPLPRSSPSAPSTSTAPQPVHTPSSDPATRLAVKPAPPPVLASPAETVAIPGPLRSFLRMAGVSQKAMPADVLPLLAHTVFQHGYKSSTPTEFLLLIQRYVSQARELQALAGSGNAIKVSGCDEAGKLLQILGYRFRKGCGGKDSALETANPDRAFLTIDSGFPLIDLEESIQNGTPFVYPYASSRLPVLFRESDWVSVSASQKLHYGNLLDILVNDPAIGRLYWAISRTDAETGRYLQQRLSLRALMPVAPALDFYGSQISIRADHVLVPGGPGADLAWKNLVGASPESPATFVPRLLSRDDGWLAAYFDALSRVDRNEQEHLTQPARLSRYYTAFHSADTKASAVAHTFRQANDLLLLDTRLAWEPSGDPHIPGTLDAWKQILQQKSNASVVRDWNRRNHPLDRPDQLIETMTALSRAETETGPLQLYLTMSELDRRRPAGQKLSAATVTLLAAKFAPFSHWYPVFSEFPTLTDASIARFIEVAEGLEQIHNQSLRANALGAFQANLGLWQILARQHQIPSEALNPSWLAVVDPYAKIGSAPQLFDSARASLTVLLQASGNGPTLAPSAIIDRLAGPTQSNPEAVRVHDELASRIHAVLEDQQLVSLDTLFALSDGLAKMQQTGEKGSDDLVTLSSELRGFELPKAIFSNSEKASWAPGVYTSHHAELQIQTDLTKVIKGPGSRAQLEAARGQLVPFLRDTLVGLNYAYYEPPGAQVLHINPLFVRAHDFLGVSVIGSDRPWQPPSLIGAGISAGGGAYLMGSLADLPHSLAEAEEDFIVPENVQALIWRELVPDLVMSATLPRWWNVTPTEMHAIALYQRSGEEVLHAAVKDPAIRANVVRILSPRTAPQRMDQLDRAMLSDKDVSAAIPLLLPADIFYLSQEYRRLDAAASAASGPAGKELATLAADDLEPSRLSADFGVPHPTLARTNARELLNVPPFPLSSGYTNRLFGESLESGNLYWARLADEMGYAPAMLHLLVPELTRQMVGKIFATNIEDWPAVLRAMQETGEDLRSGKISVLRKKTTTEASAQGAPEPRPEP